MESCGMSLVKCFVVIFNILLLIIGICLIAIGALVQVYLSEYEDVLGAELGDLSSTITAFFITIGVIIFLVAFLGCCGAWKEVKWMLFLYTFLLIVIFICEFAIFILAFVKKFDTEEEIKKGLLNTLVRIDYKSPEGALLVAWNELQKELTCCGAESSEDWKMNPSMSSNDTDPNLNGTNILKKTGNKNITAQIYPISCCEDLNDCGTLVPGNDAVRAVPDTTQLNEIGCVASLSDIVEGNIDVIAIAGVIFTIFQLIGSGSGIIVAVCMVRSIE